MGLFKASSIDKKYTVDKKELGSGNFAVVKKGTVKKGVKDAPTGLVEGSEVAVKIIDKAKVNSLATVVHGCFSLLHKHTHRARRRAQVEDMNDITREIEVSAQLRPRPTSAPRSCAPCTGASIGTLAPAPGDELARPPQRDQAVRDLRRGQVHEARDGGAPSR